MHFLLSSVFAALTVLLSFAFATSKTSTHKPTHTPAHTLTHNSTHNATNATRHLNYIPYIERPLMQEDCEIGLHFNPDPDSYNVSIILWNYNGTKIGSLKTWSGQHVLIPTSLDPTKKLKLELNNVPFKSDYEKLNFTIPGKSMGFSKVWWWYGMFKGPYEGKKIRSWYSTSRCEDWDKHHTCYAEWNCRAH